MTTQTDNDECVSLMTTLKVMYEEGGFEAKKIKCFPL